MAATRETARLKLRYEQEIRPELIRRFGYSSPMQAPVIRKITLNMGVGDAKQDTKALDAATEQLATIAGQKPNIRRARKSVAAFKLREGMPVGITVTLRGERGYEFLDRLMSIAIPRIRDFRGMNPRSFDGRGNYSLGVREQIIFPEIDYDSIDQTRGMDITITTSAQTDAEAYALLEALGFPFARDATASAAAWRAADADAEAAAAAAEPDADMAALTDAERAAQEPVDAEPPADDEALADAEPPADDGALAHTEPTAEIAPQAPDAQAEPAAEVAEEEPEASASLELEADGEAEAAQEPEAEPETVAETEAQEDTAAETVAVSEAEVGAVAQAEPDEAETVAEPEASQEGAAPAPPTDDEE